MALAALIVVRPPSCHGRVELVSSSERRQGAGLAIELSVEYKRLNTFFADYTRNISKGGTFIRTERPLDVATEFVFALTIRGLVRAVRLRGRVKWIVTLKTRRRVPSRDGD